MLENGSSLNNILDSVFKLGSSSIWLACAPLELAHSNQAWFIKRVLWYLHIHGTKFKFLWPTFYAYIGKITSICNLWMENVVLWKYLASSHNFNHESRSLFAHWFWILLERNNYFLMVHLEFCCSLSFLKHISLPLFSFFNF